MPDLPAWQSAAANLFAAGASFPDATADTSKGLTFGGDTHLFRPAAGQLQVDGYLIANRLIVDPTGASFPGAGIYIGGDVQITRNAASSLTSNAIFQADLKTSAASVITARAGGAAAALPAAPVRYLAMRDENGNRLYVPAYT